MDKQAIAKRLANFAKGVKQFRLEREQTQLEFAETLDITGGQVQHMENLRSGTSLEVLCMLRELGFSIDAALDGATSVRDEKATILGLLNQMTPDEQRQARLLLEAMLKGRGDTPTQAE